MKLDLLIKYTFKFYAFNPLNYFYLKKVKMASNYDLYSTGLTQGTLLNSRFEIIEKIGQGGFGQVYSAHDNENRGEK